MRKPAAKASNDRVMASEISRRVLRRERFNGGYAAKFRRGHNFSCTKSRGPEPHGYAPERDGPRRENNRIHSRPSRPGYAREGSHSRTKVNRGANNESSSARVVPKGGPSSGDS